jgi:isocitrate dehydrogenase (NAD+)
MMLRHLGEKDAAQRVEKAIAGVIAEGIDVTYDFKPLSPEKAVGTSQVADAVIKKMRRA